MTTKRANQIKNTDVLSGLASLADESAELAIAVSLSPLSAPNLENKGIIPGDPSRWIPEIARILIPNGSFWLIAGDENAAELKILASRNGFYLRNWVIWHYTFGIHSTRRFTQSHRHLLYFVRNENDFTFNSSAIRVPSARQLVYGDRRANPSGRIPDDTWILRPQEIPAVYDGEQDVWHFARVGQSFHQRAQYYGGEIPEPVAGRIIQTSSKPGDTVLIPFLGSGTTAAAAKKLGRFYLGFETDPILFQAASERIRSVQAGEPLAEGEIPAPKNNNSPRPEPKTPLFDESEKNSD